jgi:hypothetical protein
MLTQITMGGSKRGKPMRKSEPRSSLFGMEPNTTDATTNLQLLDVDFYY